MGPERLNPHLKICVCSDNSRRNCFQRLVIVFTSIHFTLIFLFVQTIRCTKLDLSCSIHLISKIKIEETHSDSSLGHVARLDQNLI